MTLKERINYLLQLRQSNYGKDFLLTSEKSVDELKAVGTVAEILKEFHRQNIAFKVFKTGLGISIFRDNSTRTRFSFASAINALGLSLSELDEVKSQIAHGETIRETANMISFLAEAIGIRDDMYLGEGNKYMREVADAVTEGYERGVLHRRPCVINLQCDIDHPTQTMADLLMLKKYFGSYENLKGKKIAMTWAYSPSYGKPLSVPQGIISLMTRFGMDVTLAYPKGYNLIPEIEKEHNVKIVNDMNEAFKDADVVYPKSWAPYAVMEERTELLKNSDKKGLADLEKRCLENNAKHKDWTCDSKKMKLTHNGSALYMHCLPADITGVSCAEGEVSKNVFEKYRIDTYKQASFKPFVIAAMIFLSKVSSPIEKLNNIILCQE
ncbi:MAG TPA: knotted carbamoyltransferase YgeW [Ignavibacteria bacterium]|nr:knotted carbamoyltransferase YgeW [Ignavibacteria bacterium]